MKSSRPGSAHCRSPNTRTVRPAAPAARRRSARRQKVARIGRCEPPRGRADVRGAAPPSAAPPGRARKRRRSAVELLARAVGCLVLGDPGAHPDHLGERRVGDSVAVAEAAPAVPPDHLGQSVHVLLELPGQPRLADAGNADDREQPCLALLRGGMQELLEHAQLAVATDEGRLEAGRTQRATARGDHAGCAPEPDRFWLALERVHPRVLVDGSRPMSPARSPRRRGHCPARRRTGHAKRC